MKKLALTALCAFSVSAALTLSASMAVAGETGQHCEVVPKTCAVDHNESKPNQLPTPEQIDWENHPLYKHDGLPPKDAK